MASQLLCTFLGPVCLIEVKMSISGNIQIEAAQSVMQAVAFLGVQIPQSEARLTHAKRAAMTAAATVIQRWWRHVLWRKSAHKRKQDR